MTLNRVVNLFINLTKKPNELVEHHKLAKLFAKLAAQTNLLTGQQRLQDSLCRCSQEVRVQVFWGSVFRGRWHFFHLDRKILYL